jgi:hypothetical protein
MAVVVYHMKQPQARSLSLLACHALASKPCTWDNTALKAPYLPAGTAVVLASNLSLSYLALSGTI